MRRRTRQAKPKREPKLTSSAERGLVRAQATPRGQGTLFGVQRGGMQRACTHVCATCGAHDPELGGYWPVDTGAWYCRLHIRVQMEKTTCAGSGSG